MRGWSPKELRSILYVKANAPLPVLPNKKTQGKLVSCAFYKKNITANSKNLENKMYLQRQNILTEVPVGVTWPGSLFPDDIILSQASNVDDFLSMSDKLSFSSCNLIECPASRPSFFSSCSIMLSNWRISAICKNYKICITIKDDRCTQSSILK